MSLKYVLIYVNEDSHAEQRLQGREEAQSNEVSGGPPQAARHLSKREKPSLRGSGCRRAAIRA
jgi:hypothetical protein